MIAGLLQSMDSKITLLSTSYGTGQRAARVGRVHQGFTFLFSTPGFASWLSECLLASNLSADHFQSGSVGEAIHF